MKNVRSAILGMVLISIASCGAAGDLAQAARELMDASYLTFTGIIDADSIQACRDSGSVDCACPGGGVFSVDDANGTITMTNCASEGGDVYTGTVVLVGGDTPAQLTFTQFGGCVDVTIRVEEVTCEGTGTGECDDAAVGCIFILADDGTCNISC